MKYSVGDKVVGKGELDGKILQNKQGVVVYIDRRNILKGSPLYKVAWENFIEHTASGYAPKGNGWNVREWHLKPVNKKNPF